MLILVCIDADRNNVFWKSLEDSALLQTTNFKLSMKSLSEVRPLTRREAEGKPLLATEETEKCKRVLKSGILNSRDP